MISLQTMAKTIDIEVTKLYPRTSNPNKMSDEEYGLLKLAIERFGFLQPVLVRRGDAGAFEVVDGAHRLRIANELAIKKIPCVVREQTDDVIARILQVGMNRNRGKLDLGAVAAQVVDLVDSGCSIPDLVFTGYNEEDLRELVALANASAESVLQDADIPTTTTTTDTTASEQQHTLEIDFDNRKDFLRVRRALRRIGEGDTAVGLLRLIDGA